MASRWFVFWIAVFIIGTLQGDGILAAMGLICAAASSVPKTKAPDGPVDGEG